MTDELRERIVSFFKVEFANKLKLKLEAGYSLSDFNIHPFTLLAISSSIFGQPTSLNMAKALVYPRALGTSMNTNFGDLMQRLCVSILDASASSTQGMDLEFVDKTDNKKVIMQLKAGPNTINKDDIEPMIEKYKTAHRLLLRNYAGENMPKFALGITYGNLTNISYHFKRIASTTIGNQEDMPIYIGKDFWYRLTGNEDFYIELINIFIEIFQTENYEQQFESSIIKLAKNIEEEYFTNGIFDPSKL